MAVEFSGLELVEKLVAITPAPRANLVRYHGTLAPNAHPRASIVPHVAEGRTGASGKARADGDCGGPKSGATGYRWAELMARVFEKDALECMRCGGRLKLVATINEASVIRAILECIGLSARPPPLGPARGPWQGELEFHDG